MLRITDPSEQSKTAILDTNETPLKIVADGLALQSLVFDLKPEPSLTVTFTRIDPSSGRILGPLTQIKIRRRHLRTLFQAQDKEALRILRQFVRGMEKLITAVGDFPGVSLKGKIAEDPSLPDHLDGLDDRISETEG